MGCTIDRWTAKAAGTGEDRAITVRGEGECTKTGYELRLDQVPDGVVEEPDVVTLRLSVEEPEVGNPVMTPISVEAVVPDEAATKVRIQTADGLEGIDVEEG
jgi:hypothetical protein